MIRVVVQQVFAGLELAPHLGERAVEVRIVPRAHAALRTLFEQRAGG
jgi:hypothetical protein